jgi:hypothetical protein
VSGLTANLYGLYDPDTNELRYIGKANDAAKRFKTHLWDSGRNNRPVCNWIRGLVAAGKRPIMRIIEVVSADQWKEAETRLIAQYRQTHKLLNLADGGDRPSQTLEQKRKAGRASIKSQRIETQEEADAWVKKDIWDYYKSLCKKPDIKTYWLRMKMKCWAADDPEKFGCWAKL